MLKPKTNFKSIWKLLLQSDTISGLFLFKDPPDKKTPLLWIFRLTFVRQIFLMNLLLISTLITTNFKLISVVLCASLGSQFLNLLSTILNYKRNKDIVKNLLKWCEELYDVENKYHPLVQNVAKIHLMTIEKRTNKVLKLFRNVVYIDCITVTFGWLFLGIVLPESIIPKFTPPLPFYLPFKNQDNWTAFLVTMLIQIIATIDVATILTYIFSIIFAVVVHILGYLDLIHETIKCMRQEIFKNFKNNNKIFFDEWMKTLTEMISDVNVKISIMRNFYSIPFLSMELSIFASLFTSGLVLTVVHEQYFFAVGVNVMVPIFWALCFTNEKILDRFDAIKDALYDIPWYELEPKQRKSLLIVMSCDKIQNGFTAARVHNLTIERFSIIVRSAYAKILILKDLVQK